MQPEGAGEIALNQLAVRGLRGIAYAGPPQDFFSQGRLRGVRSAARKQRLPEPIVWPVPDGITGGAEAAEQWLALSTSRRPQGLIGFTDAIAVGFLHRLLVKGRRIPAEVSVVGVDDTLLAAASAVPLSTVRAPVESIGRKAVEIITQTEEFQKGADLRPVWEWVERESTRRS